MSVETVQKWVMSVLAVTTIYHLGSVSAIAAVLADDDRFDAQVGLNVIAAFFGVVGVAAGLLIHGRSPWSPWLLLGLLPGIVGAFFTFW